MTKRRIVTIILTLLLCATTIGLQIVWKNRVITTNPFFIQCMLTATAILVFFGCMLQSIGHPRIAVIVSDIVFVVLCICIFYAKSATEILVFAGCMFIVLKRASNACECSREQSCKK